jgi:DNA-binding transcriptional MerR regulator
MRAQVSLRSSKFARLVGVSPDTLRMYERKGLLCPPARSANGYRCYSADSLARVRLIRAALSIGFTLEELAQILRIRDGGGAPCHQVRNLAETKLKRLDECIQELVALRQQLSKTLRNWDRILRQKPRQGRAELLQSLASSGPKQMLKLPPHLFAAITREP